MSRTQPTTRFLLLVTLALPALASAASAWHPASNEAGYTYHPDHFQVGKSRADVRAEVDAARKNGTLTLYQRGMPIPAPTTGQPRTPGEVAAELKAETPAQRRERVDMLLGR